MGIFDNLRRRRELDKLENAARDNPSPLNLCEYAERLMAYDERDKALEIAKRAMERYPDNERVVTAYRYIMKTIHQARIQELQKSIDKSPNPGGFARLAELNFRELGDLDGAMEVARRGISQFPEDESLHQINGMIRFYRFHEDYLAKDGLSAVEHFQKAVSLNSLNYKCQFLLAVLAAEVEGWDLARQSIGQIWRFAPDDEGVRALETKVNELAPRSAPRESLDVLFRNVEVRGRLSDLGQPFASLHPAEVTARRTASKVDSRRLQEILGGLVGIDSFQGAVMIDARGRLLAGHGTNIPSDAMSKAVQEIATTAQDSSKRMDIGAIHRIEIETPAGSIHVVAVRNMFLALAFAATAKRDEVNATVEQFLDRLAKEEEALGPR